jgi:hypothetical protein
MLFYEVSKKFLPHSGRFRNVSSESKERWNGYGQGVDPDEGNNQEGLPVRPDLSVLHVAHAHPPMSREGRKGTDRHRA